MIVDLQHFLTRRRPLWEEYDDLLTRLENNGSLRLDLEEIQRLGHLHETVAGDLVRVRTFASEPETVAFLESLLARGFGFIHESKRFRISRLNPLRGWGAFPRALRAHKTLFLMVCAAFLFGMAVGGALVLFAPDAKDVLIPFGHLHGDPSDRVADEEAAVQSGDTLHTTFAAYLMVHNIRVSLFVFALGILAGVFTLVLVFYNGVILGAVCVDYVVAGEGIFLTGWLLPHGSVEIPAILFAATAGLVLAQRVLLREDRRSFLARMRSTRKDLLHLLGGVAMLLIWAGIIESFFSQFHAPVLPYAVKIAFGVVQSGLLMAYLLLAGRQEPEPEV